MQAEDARRAVAAAMRAASALELTVDGAVVLNDSNRLVVRLKPCDVVARIAIAPSENHAWLATELDVARSLRETGAPFAGLEPLIEPRVFMRDGFAITFWTYFEPVARMVSPAAYARALEQLHSGLRQVEAASSHFMDRVAMTRDDVVSREITPDLAEEDRALLVDTLRDLASSVVSQNAPEQLLHGEPHPWNVLNTKDGPLFMDFENATRGPIEYDLAWAPAEVSERYPGADRDLVGECRGLVLAMIAMHRWRKADQHPSGRQSGVAFLESLRAGPPWPPLDTV
jgi:aminoglycoside phosphotransferase (APT) family kinase protein